jgi:uncharacterized membrane protein YvbJ
MRCKKCNTENNYENKFCIKCGAELNNHHSGTKFCTACGTENNKSVLFCANCGYNISNVKSSAPHKESRKKPKRQSRKQPDVLSFASIIKKHKIIAVAATVFFVFLIYQSLPKSSNYNNIKYTPAGVESSIASAMSDSVTAAVVKEFNCACGECNDPLDICTCETAVEERGIIETKAARNMSLDGIITAVSNKYGGLKSSSDLKFGG